MSLLTFHMDERDRVFEGLSEDLQVARASALLAYHLRTTIQHRSSLVRLAEDAIWLTLRAVRDTSVIHLWKAYDTQSRARSLPWFIRKCSVAQSEVKSQDLEHISPKHNGDIGRLQRLRHDLFAHRGEAAGNMSSADLLAASDLPEARFLRLIDEAERLLQRHSGRDLPRRLAHRASDAIRQLADLDAYLVDALPGRWGIERFVPEVDGNVRAGRGQQD